MLVHKFIIATVNYIIYLEHSLVREKVLVKEMVFYINNESHIFAGKFTNIISKRNR